MSTQEDLDFAHQVYKNDPILFKSYVGKKIKIMMKDKNVHYGVVYTVDPVSERYLAIVDIQLDIPNKGRIVGMRNFNASLRDVVLLQAETSTQYHLKIIFNHAIKNIEVTSEAEVLVPELFSLSPANLSEVTVTKRKNIVMQLLLDNRFPVKEEDDILFIEDTVSIKPPYYPENCNCTNSIILNKVQSILTHVNVE